MPSPRIHREENQHPYFLTFTVHRWYYLFDRHGRWEILLNSLKYCQQHKGLKVYNWVFMLNHIHLVVSSPDVIGFVRDFKRFTTKALKENIEQTEGNILKLFLEKGKYQFWKSDNMPELIKSREFYMTKAKYVEDNPVKKGYVRLPEHWVYSSANRNEPLLDLGNPR